MKVGLNWKTGLEWVLTSWKSQDDPGTGDHTFRLHSDQSTTSPQYFMYKGLRKYWRSDPGPGPSLVTNQEETYYILNYTDAITRMTLTDSDGLKLNTITCIEMRVIKCLRNCSCTAYLSIENEGIVDCLIWYDDLMDILVYTELGRDLYVRVNATVLGTNLLAMEANSTNYI
ncbi:putative PAN/Apple domain-containing protein [Rosa chinensis]|uniref:Putative PAN/Apple domain-containing protein n=1 Tax=Rosa chinensis TaxID=74649 RepID=A0A2P6PDQ7_ROSCH|nr:putative PAN/Apple domain-containing protein [Rosa chinensis]